MTAMGNCNFTLEQFEKFFANHPEIPDMVGESVIKTANMAMKNGVVSGNLAEMILGPLAQDFALEIMVSEESESVDMRTLART